MSSPPQAAWRVDAAVQAVPQASNLSIFRVAALLVGVAVGLQPLVLLWQLGPVALPHLHSPPLVPLWLSLTHGGQLPALFASLIAACLIGLVVFAAGVVRLTSTNRPAYRVLVAWLAVQALVGLGLAQEWLYVVAAEAALLMPARQAWRWWLIQAAGLAALQLLHAAPLQDPLLSCNLAGPASLAPPQRVLLQTLFDVTTALMFQALAFGAGALARMEERRRAALGATQRELLAARQLIGAAAASQERLRIARELHDSVGHHLTVMKLHLDLAMRQSEVTGPLSRAAQLAQELLAEVRALVGAERGAAAVRAVEGDPR